MIEMPSRSITRFFIPMIDVLTLLFCIYLLMPIASAEDGEDPADRAEAERRLRELEAAAGAKAGPLDAKLRDELERLRKERIEALRQRLSLRVLEVDGKTGDLFYRDPDPVPIGGPADARKLISRDREAVGPARELYYVILAPRDRTAAHPTREEADRFRDWFAGVALGFDYPGAGPGRKP